MDMTAPYRTRSRWLRLGLAALAVAGCSTAPANEPGSGGDDDDGGDLVDAGPPVAQSLPFTVDDAFIPGGYMGDGASGAIVMSGGADGEDPTCGGDEAPAANGPCHAIAYQPVDGGAGWGGVYWLYPADNWGTQPGLPIAAGAQAVDVKARGAVGGEVVKLGVAGVADPNGQMPYNDGFKAEITATLTTEWQSLTIDLSSYSYQEVLGGFYWVADTASNPSGVSFQLDGLVWR